MSFGFILFLLIIFVVVFFVAFSKRESGHLNNHKKYHEAKRKIFTNDQSEHTKE